MGRGRQRGGQGVWEVSGQCCVSSWAPELPCPPASHRSKTPTDTLTAESVTLGHSTAVQEEEATIIRILLRPHAYMSSTHMAWSQCPLSCGWRMSVLHCSSLRSILCSSCPTWPLLFKGNISEADASRASTDIQR